MCFVPPHFHDWCTKNFNGSEQMVKFTLAETFALNGCFFFNPVALFR